MVPRRPTSVVAAQARNGAPDSGEDADLLRLRALLTLRDLELHALTVLQRFVAIHVDRGEVDEDVLPSVDRDEAIALLAVEPLDGALCHGALPHFDGAGSADPRPHRGAGAATTTECLAGHWESSDRIRTLHEADPTRTPPFRTAGHSQASIGFAE